MTCRSYISVLTRSHHTQAHKKLTHLQRRWVEATRLLEPSIDLLPHLLIVPVVLFVIGLLDTVISSSVPLTEASAPVFIAGILSSGFAITIASYTIWTVYHCCRNPETSPFQSSVSRAMVIYVTPVLEQIQTLYRDLHTELASWSHNIRLSLNQRRPSPPSSTALLDAVSVDSYDTRLQSPTIQKNDEDDGRFLTYMSVYEHEAFHDTFIQVHEDDILDQAAAAYFSIVDQHRIEFRASSGRNPSGYSELTYHEKRSLAHMLSAEASLRSNMTAAIIIRECVASSPQHWFRGEDIIQFLQLLVESAQRYSLATTGLEVSTSIWSSPFTIAMLLLVDARSGYNRHHRYDEEKHPSIDFSPGTSLSPVLALLLSEEIQHDSSLNFLAEFVQRMVIKRFELNVYHPFEWSERIAIRHVSSHGDTDEIWNELIEIMPVACDDRFWLSFADSLQSYRYPSVIIRDLFKE